MNFCGIYILLYIEKNPPKTLNAFGKEKQIGSHAFFGSWSTFLKRSSKYIEDPTLGNYHSLIDTFYPLDARNSVCGVYPRSTTGVYVSIAWFWPHVQLILHLSQSGLSLTGNMKYTWPLFSAFWTTQCICWSCLVIVALAWQWACLTAWHNVHVEWSMFLWLLCETSSIKRCKVAVLASFSRPAPASSQNDFCDLLIGGAGVGLCQDSCRLLWVCACWLMASLKCCSCHSSTFIRPQYLVIVIL